MVADNPEYFSSSRGACSIFCHVLLVGASGGLKLYFLHSIHTHNDLSICYG